MFYFKDAILVNIYFGIKINNLRRNQNPVTPGLLSAFFLHLEGSYIIDNHEKGFNFLMLPHFFDT